MSLGLDLRGGVYFLYEVDVQGAVKQLLHEHGARLPHDAAQRAHPVHRRGQRRRGHGDDRPAQRRRRQTVAAVLRKQDPNLSVDDRDARRGRVRHRQAERRRRSSSGRTSRSSRTSPRCATASTNSASPSRSSPGRASTASSCSCPACQDPNEALRVLGATATLEFRLVDDQNDACRGRAHQARAARLEALPHAREPPGPAQARHRSSPANS